MKLEGPFIIMEGLGGVVAPIGPEGLRKSPDGGSTLLPLTESDMDEFRSGSLLVESGDVDADGNPQYRPRPGSFLTEKKTSDGFLYIYGPMAQCDEKNGNGRIYERGIWETVAGDKETIERHKMGDAKGHLEHPENGRTNLNLVSHVMVPAGPKGEPFVIDEDGIVYGKARILNTNPGKQLQELYRGGVRVGFSSRGKGSTYRKRNADWVARDYKYDVMDAVASPSVGIAKPKLENFEPKFTKYSLASSQTESIQSSTEATSNMTNAKDILKQLEESLRETAGKLEESQDAIALASLRESLLENQMQIRGVVEQDPTTRDVAEDLLSQAKELRSKVTVQMESLTDKTLDEAVEEAVAAPLAESEEAPSDEVTQLKALLSETKDRLDYYRNLCEELADTENFVTRKEYEAALALSEGLLKKAKELQSDNVELAEALENAGSLEEGQHPEYEALNERYQKALLIIEELTDRIRSAQVADRVEEVIRQESRFAKIRDDLLECETVEEVNSRIARLSRLFEDDSAEAELPPAPEGEEEAVVEEDVLEESQTDVEEPPAAQITESKAHRLGLIDTICGTDKFRK